MSVSNLHFKKNLGLFSKKCVVFFLQVSVVIYDRNIFIKFKINCYNDKKQISSSFKEISFNLE